MHIHPLRPVKKVGHVLSGPRGYRSTPKSVFVPGGWYGYLVKLSRQPRQPRGPYYLLLQGPVLGLVPMSTVHCCRPLTGRYPAVAVPRRAEEICATSSSHAMWTHEFAVLDVIAMTTLPMC